MSWMIIYAFVYLNVSLLPFIWWLRRQARGIDELRNQMPSSRFEHRGPFTPSLSDTPAESLRLAIGIVCLLPFNLILFSLTMLALYICSACITGISFLQSRYLSHHRRTTQAIQHGFLYVMQKLARIVAFSLGVWHVNVIGQPDPAAEIMISNHTGFLDSVIFFSQFLPLVLMAKEYQSYPFIGTIVTALDGIMVERCKSSPHQGSSSSRRNAVLEQVEQYTLKKRLDLSLASAAVSASPNSNVKATKLGYANRPVLIYPEGTTTNGAHLIQFKKGAFSVRAQVQICHLYFDGFDPSWIEAGYSGIMIFIRLLAGVNRTVHCRYGKLVDTSLPPAATVITTDGSTTEIATKMDPSDVVQFYTDVCQRDMLALANAWNNGSMGITQYSYEDVLLQREATKLNVHPVAALIEFGKLKEEFKTLTYKFALLHFVKFVNMLREQEKSLQQVGTDLLNKKKNKKNPKLTCVALQSADPLSVLIPNNSNLRLRFWSYLCDYSRTPTGSYSILFVDYFRCVLDLAKSGLKDKELIEVLESMT